MRYIFKKAHLPLLNKVIHGEGSGRDAWTVARLMQDRDGMQHQLPSELIMLERGVAEGDIWSACELARTYFEHGGDLSLPRALSLWKRAAEVGDNGALWDLANRPIRDRILAYRLPSGDDYTTIQMRCAMLTELHLTGFGTARWCDMTDDERLRRCRALVAECCPVLGIDQIYLFTTPRLTFNGNTVDALAYPDGRVELRHELLPDIERTVQLIFHELGHHVAFDMMRGGSKGQRLQQIYGISSERIASWSRGDMGYEVPTSEEDPDTLSYGVYTDWAAYFIMRFN